MSGKNSTARDLPSVAAGCYSRATHPSQSPLTRWEAPMDRRRFMTKAGVAAAATAALADATNAIAQPKIQWRMATSWTPALDVLQGNAQRFAKMIEEMSGGRFKIQV